MALSKENGLDSTLGARKNALIAPIPNTREQQERTQQVVWEHAVSRPDYVDLMCVLFQPPRPDHRADAAGEHPADCGCKKCAGRRRRAAARTARILPAVSRGMVRRGTLHPAAWWCDGQDVTDLVARAADAGWLLLRGAHHRPILTQAGRDRMGVAR